ncbi:MAG: hypothetical protein ACLVC1_12965 [Mediterraneibacter gnavus]
MRLLKGEGILCSCTAIYEILARHCWRQEAKGAYCVAVYVSRVDNAGWRWNRGREERSRKPSCWKALRLQCRPPLKRA